jgi:hypothetical protein
MNGGFLNSDRRKATDGQNRPRREKNPSSVHVKLGFCSRKERRTRTKRVQTSSGVRKVRMEKAVRTGLRGGLRKTHKI